MSNEIWIEIEKTNDGVMVIDWTETVQYHWRSGHMREYYELRPRFTPVYGKDITYYIQAKGATQDDCKALAIWHYTTIANGSLNKYRLDFLYISVDRKTFKKTTRSSR